MRTIAETENARVLVEAYSNPELGYEIIIHAKDIDSFRSAPGKIYWGGPVDGLLARVHQEDRLKVWTFFDTRREV